MCMEPSLEYIFLWGSETTISPVMYLKKLSVDCPQ